MTCLRPSPCVVLHQLRNTIPQDTTTFPHRDFALKTQGSDGDTFRAMQLTIVSRNNDMTYCADVREAGTYCPILRTSSPATQTISAASECDSVKQLVAEVQQAQGIEPEDEDDDDGSGSSDPVDNDGSGSGSESDGEGSSDVISAASEMHASLTYGLVAIALAATTVGWNLAT